jgi:hypothetical protein
MRVLQQGVFRSSNKNAINRRESIANSYRFVII